MPPVCEHCKKIGHNIKRCKSALVLCDDCKSTAHTTEHCPRKGKGMKKSRNHYKGLVVGKREGNEIWVESSHVEKQSGKYITGITKGSPSDKGQYHKDDINKMKIGEGTEKIIVLAEEKSQVSDVEEDSSDVSSTNMMVEESETSQEKVFVEVKSKNKKNKKGNGGNGPKTN